MQNSMSNVHCRYVCRVRVKANAYKSVHSTQCVFVCGCAYVDDCAAAHVHERTCVMTRPRQGMPCSCLFHLMRQSQALIDSIYLALTLICQDAARQTASGPMESVSQLQNVFHFFLCRNKGVQTCIHSSSKRSPFLSRLHASFMSFSVKSILLQGSQCWHLN